MTFFISALAVLAALAPSARGQEAQFSSDKSLINNVSQAIADYVEKKGVENEDGKFRMKDGASGKTWRLDFGKVRKDRISRLGANRYAASADFRGKLAGKGPVSDVELGFYLTWGEGDWSVNKVFIQSVNGEARAAGAPAPGKAAGGKPKLQKVSLPGAEQKESGFGQGQAPAMPVLPANMQIPQGQDGSGQKRPY